MAVGIVVPYTFATQNGPLPLANLDSDILTPYQALSAFATYGNYLVDSSGAANSITVTTPTNTTFSYTAGVPIQVKLANTNTAAAVSINVNGLGSVSVLNADGTNPAVGQLVAAQILPMIYNGTAFVLVGPQSKPSSIAPFTVTAAGNVTLPAPSSGVALALNAVAGNPAAVVTGSTGAFAFQVSGNNSAGGNGADIRGGTSGSDYCVFFRSSALASLGYVAGDGSVVLGNPSGGAEGLGTINVATGISINGNPVYSGIPQTSISASYTTVLGDANKHILCGGGSAKTVTLAANSSVPYPIGTAITVVNAGGGVVTLSCSDTILFAPSGSTGSRTFAATASGTLLKITSVEWLLTGVGVT